MAPWDPRVSGSALIPVTPPTWRVAVSGGGTISPSIPLLTAPSSPLAPELILWDRAGGVKGDVMKRVKEKEKRRKPWGSLQLGLDSFTPVVESLSCVYGNNGIQKQLADAAPSAAAILIPSEATSRSAFGLPAEQTLKQHRAAYREKEPSSFTEETLADKGQGGESQLSVKPYEHASSKKWTPQVVCWGRVASRDGSDICVVIVVVSTVRHRAKNVLIKGVSL
ncbi:hypothetical protein EYF80_023299 [Liparis tanakae]|uniref:Uncharacterized protein n=1 Tax=Liparis tanakae TaxID=230148 RepID=A0A4Z2HL25_9TELE|nr:hypothetical protein EYF80_023299 [Liparis tanakae]